MEQKHTHVPFLAGLVLIGSTIPFFSLITTHAMEAVTLNQSAQVVQPIDMESVVHYRRMLRMQQGGAKSSLEDRIPVLDDRGRFVTPPCRPAQDSPLSSVKEAIRTERKALKESSGNGSSATTQDNTTSDAVR